MKRLQRDKHGKKTPLREKKYTKKFSFAWHNMLTNTSGLTAKMPWQC